ncbi:RIC1-domain-containing protein [Fusarium acuminatum]|uniref:RIC1-domain-containing protein n=1 Tax=Fusarium acuminatum TaxID=5515 RepID=A0ABZ2WH21_9HYPO
MVIKVDAGIESALALDDELMVSTTKPAAVQCIRWTPDSTGSQTRTEIISRMGWVEKKATIVEMTHDRPMNLLTWITSSGRAYAVQRYNHRAENSQPDDADAKRLFKGHCFHTPQGENDRAITAVINARFSLIAVGCCDGTVQVYSVRDYAGNIPHSHTHQVPVSTASSGAFTSLTYSPDGYCLFAGFQKGWSTWSMFGKLGSHSFGSEETMSRANGEEWLSGIACATWVGGGSEILMTGRKHEAIWTLEMAKNAVTGCYNEANVFRTVLQTPSSVMVYRGYDVPDLTSISAEPFLWHTANVPPAYLLNQWPIRQTVISPDGRYVAVAGRRGLAHYSVNSGRWKTFTNETMENEFQVRGGMCWHQHILVAAVEANRRFELRLFSRETALDSTQILHTQSIPAPVVLVTTSGEDSLLVYTYENLLYHFIFTPHGGSIRLIQVGQIAFHGIVRSPARVRGLSWILPDTQLTDGDPSQDVAVASVIFLVDGKLVLLRPSLNEEGQLKYDMRVIAQNVEYHASVRDQPLRNASQQLEDSPLRNGPPALKDSLWVFDGMELKAWPDINEVLDATGETGKEAPSPGMFYNLCGHDAAADIEQTHLILPDLLRFYLRHSRSVEASNLAHQYKELEYFAHGLEILLHRVLDEEVDTSPKPVDAVLPRVLSLLSSFKEYLDIVLQCTRKTEVRQWKTLFAYLPQSQELFEESLQRGSLKTAGGYLIILHTLDELGSSTEQSVRLLSRAMREGDWELCKELARFLAAMDETGETLQEAMKMVGVALKQDSGQDSIGARLQIPPSRVTNGGGSGLTSGDEDGTSESDRRSGSDAGSVASTISAN